MAQLRRRSRYTEIIRLGTAWGSWRENTCPTCGAVPQERCRRIIKGTGAGPEHDGAYVQYRDKPHKARITRRPYHRKQPPDEQSTGETQADTP